MLILTLFRLSRDGMILRRGDVRRGEDGDFVLSRANFMHFMF